MNFSEWFQKQLQASAEGFVWGAALVPEERRYKIPPPVLGEWTAARHIFHMQYYERTIALPSMQLWAGETRLPTRFLDEDEAWDGTIQDFDHLLNEFMKVRAEQVALLPKFEQEEWTHSRKTGWGPVTLLWVVSKTYQHTAEHTHDVMRLALFWDAF